MWGYSHYEYGGPPEEEPDEKEVFKNGKWPFGGSGSADDVPAPSGSACVLISNALSRAEGIAGEYSFSGRAETLPAMPGLFVEGVGAVPLPLCDEKAEKLIAVCRKSPFGRKMDTLMDESVRKSWQLQPDKVQLKNPLWEEGIEKLGEIIADRLGYKNMKMQCVLYKLLVYGEGGHFAKHQDTEKEDGMIATMVVQLPTLHEGGDLVVYQGKDVQFRHDFGKTDGTAAYLPHYAVHYADAEHALETVTSGYRLVLVYSICLPSEMHYLLQRHDKSQTEELTDAINRLGDGDDHDSFALLLSHEYTERSMGDMGVGALKGVDRARFQALQEANAAASPDKKVQFLLADLSLEIDFYDAGNDDWEENERSETIKWYSTSGESYGPSAEEVELNFLNPGRQTLGEFWKDSGESTFEGYLGNEGATRNTTYSRYAIVAWPAAQGVENALKFINGNAALDALTAQKQVDAAALRKFMDFAGDSSGFQQWTAGFCCKMCALLIKAGDPTLVTLFFRKFVQRLGRFSDKDAMIPSIISIIRAFKWQEIGEDLLATLGGRSEAQRYNFSYVRAYDDSGMGTILRILNGVEAGDAQKALIRAVVTEVTKIPEQYLCSSRYLGLVWKWVISCGDTEHLETVADKFRGIKPEMLPGVLDTFTPYLLSASDDKKAVLASIAARRIEWLSTQINLASRPFSWEMPNAVFPTAQVQAFLRGPGISMTTTGIEQFSRITDARRYASNHTRDQARLNASFTMEPSGVGKNAMVTITKTRTWFNQQQKEVLKYKKELKTLTERFHIRADTSHSGKKRARPVPPGVEIIELD